MKIKKIVVSVFIILFVTSLSAQRLVLLEQFSNAGCPVCGTYSPPVYQYVNNNPVQVIAIAYHVDFPHFDSLYFENPLEVNQRVAYYNVNGVPNSVIDGNVFNGASAILIPNISSTITNRAAVPPLYSISFLNNSLNGNQLDAEVVVTSLDNTNISQNLVAQIAVIEDPVYKSDYNGLSGNNTETEYPFSMRKMLPDGNGTTLLNKFLNGADTISVSWVATNFKRLSEMRVVAFVQNVTTKEIYQAAVDVPSDLTSINENTLHSDFYSLNYMGKNELQIKLSKSKSTTKIKIYNLLGKEMYSEIIDAGAESKIIYLNKPLRGFYFVQIQNAEQMKTKKIMIN